MLIEPAGIAIPGAGDRGGSRGDEQASDLAYSLDDDAALALSLQRHFDLEAMAAGTYGALSPVRVFARLGVTLVPASTPSARSSWYLLASPDSNTLL